MSSADAEWPGGYSEACVRNQASILDVLRLELGASGRVLEIGSCTGQHAVSFSAALPGLVWQPSDQSHYLPGLQANIAEYAGENVSPPVALDVVGDEWPEPFYEAIYSANTLHIMSQQQVMALFSGLSKVLLGGGTLLIYGPFNYQGQYSSPSNEAFDASLRQRDPLSGIRDFEWVDELAVAQGLALKHDYEMPANNRLLVWSYKND